MPYRELIKNFNGIRGVLRDFYVCGFHTRRDFTGKSLRSYDDQRRRVESWLQDCMRFRQEPGGKVVFLTVDNRTVLHNPLYEAYKAKSFTAWDAALHFLLLDLLQRKGAQSFKALVDGVCSALQQGNPDASLPDASTIRNKLKEGEALGLVESHKAGRSLVYRLADTPWDPSGWQTALCFASEQLPLGVIGSYLLDRCPRRISFLSFKHHYLFGALDQELACTLAEAHTAHRRVELVFHKKGRGPAERLTAYPLKIYTSAATGRSYVLASVTEEKRPRLIRLDRLEQVKMAREEPDWARLEAEGRTFAAHLWGISASSARHPLERVVLEVEAGPDEPYIPERLEREKRNGHVEQVGPTRWRFTTEVYDARELLPWLRTFIGRITRLECSNRQVEKRFWQDLETLQKLYEEE